MSEELTITYKVLHDKPITSEEISLSKSSKSSWSSLMAKVFSNKYRDLVNTTSAFRYILKDRIEMNKRFTVQELTELLSKQNIIGTVDLISSSFLFDRSPMDFQMFILAGLGIKPDMLKELNV